MFGHGSPYHSTVGVTLPTSRCALNRRTTAPTGILLRAWNPIRIFLLATLLASIASPVAAQPTDSDPRNKGLFSRIQGTLRSPLTPREPGDASILPDPTRNYSLSLRLTWGGGANKAWQGEVRLTGGRIDGFVNLGREAEDSGTFELRGNTLEIHQLNAFPYGGCDLKLTAPAHAEIAFELAPRDSPTEVKRHSVRIDQLFAQPVSYSLDDQQNRLHCARSPGDRLKVTFAHPTLIFEPSGAMNFQVQTNVTSVEPIAGSRLKVWVSPARELQELSKSEHEGRLREDDPQELEFGPVAVILPEAEGAYDIHLELLPRRTASALSLSRPKPIAHRIMQVAVVATQCSTPDSTPWRTVAEFDPGSESLGDNVHSGRWSDWLNRIPSLTPGSRMTQGPLGNQLASKRDVRGRSVVSLAPDGWMAYPLPINRIDEPHFLEVEYPSEIPQLLGISIVEPNAAGRVTPLGIDSGLEVAAPEPGHRPGWQRHRIIFWPRTRSPIVVLTNRSPTESACFGRIAIQAGPMSLPAAEASQPLADERLAAAFLDRPVFPENFGASESYDLENDGVWDDWKTFHQGAVRLAQYLKYAGYNAAVVSVASEGSAIYPSDLLRPSPKYDSGVFLSAGQDPVRKDVLELLFRVFDREGLKLVPAVHFATPLPELEQLKRESQPEGLEWIGGDGQPWSAQHRPLRGLAPHYNILDARVQQATLKVLDELERRYAHHDAWHGLALQLGPETYASLPSPAWGFDDLTVERFCRSVGLDVPGKGQSRHRDRSRFLLGEARAQWLAWRASELTRWYAEAQQIAARRRPHSPLLLATHGLPQSAQLLAISRPALPQKAAASDALLSVGLAPNKLADSRGIVLLRPYLQGPVAQLSANGGNLEWNRSAELDRLLLGRLESGVLSYHESHPLALPEFDKLSPFGPEATRLWMATHFVRSGEGVRQRLTRGLASGDAGIFVDGGWLLPHGGEDSLRSALLAFRALPALASEPIPALNDSQRQSLVVRQYVRESTTTIVAINDAAWHADLDLVIEAPNEVQMRESHAALTPAPRDAAIAAHSEWVRESDAYHWRSRLAPFEMRVIEISGAARVRDWRTSYSREVTLLLSDRVKDLRARANQLRTPPPLDSLRNADFETSRGDSPENWLHARGPGIQVAIDAAASHSGRQSLAVKSNKEVVWVRSDPFPAPQSGRIAVWAWLKVKNPEEQSPVRLAIEGRLDGKTYYRYATVGNAAGKSSVLQAAWTQYWFQIDDLPTTGLTDLRVGFDMMGPGEVWIDDVQLFEVWFHENERDELIKHIGLADFNLNNGKLVECERYLASYWPRFLVQHVPLSPRVAQTSRRESPGAAAPPSLDPSSSRPPDRTTWKDRFNGFWPRRGL